MAVRGALGIARALENEPGADHFVHEKREAALSLLATQMKPVDVPQAAEHLAKALEDPRETDYNRISLLAKALSNFAARLSSTDATLVVERLVKVLETDSDRVSLVAEALSALAARMNQTDAASVVKLLVKALENRWVTDHDSLSRLSFALSVLATRMDPTDAALMAKRLAKVLANSLETDSPCLSSLGEALAALAAQIPKAKKTQLTALSLPLLEEVPPPPKEGRAEVQQRTVATRICESLTIQELAAVLKWPLCVGETQNLVLGELGKKTHRDFGDDAWKFVQQVDSLGVPGLNREFLQRPAKRPRIEDTIEELEALASPAAEKP
jgi:hypothetical protein